MGHGQISCIQTCEYHDKNNGMNDMGFYGNSMRNNMGNSMMQNKMMGGNMQNKMMQNNMMRNNYRGSEAAVGSGMDSSQTDRQTCASNSDCGDESFCKFNSDANGFCESCSSIQSCNAGFMNQKSQMSCSQVCESENDENNHNDEQRMNVSYRPSYSILGGQSYELATGILR